MSSPAPPLTAADPSPIPSALLGTALFVVTETMFFTGLISAYLVLRAEAVDWPPFDQPRLPILATAFNTAALLLSGGTMLRAWRASAAGRGPVLRWLTATVLLGGLFLGLQGLEWVRLIRFGLTTSSSLYGATFYTLVGAHGLHALGGLVALCVLLPSALRGRVSSPALSAVGMFWMFVVLVWPVLYGLLYLA